MLALCSLQGYGSFCVHMNESEWEFPSETGFTMRKKKDMTWFYPLGIDWNVRSDVMGFGLQASYYILMKE